MSEKAFQHLIQRKQISKSELPDFLFEKTLAKKGFHHIAGVDEVGRGCLAGPVSAGCVVFDLGLIRGEKNIEVVINDSKKLSPKKRILADRWIKSNSVTWGVGTAPVRVINTLGIKKATEMAMRRAIASANEKLGSQKIDYLLIDAFYAPYVKGLRRKNQKPIIHGDTKSLSIAASSIIAKVFRDEFMQSLSKKRKYAKFQWGVNKGYGTLNHRRQIAKYGLTRYHRKLFCSNLVI